ncbi:MAG: gliding motility-associated C-terminal domain-containing protein, partial [Crocinitomicaceae bacterium]|nr:gliding motility-associated C-terminal domain-containing protein [Crocinitomicaceae bacterium]
YPTPPITVSPTVYAIQGDTSLIWADGDGSIIWSPPTFIACTTCPETAVWPNRPTTYTATLTDENGCLNSGNVPILYDPIIYVPNAFTPDGNSVNPYFFAVTHNIDNFKMYIFNRWGETIKIIENEGDVWDGYYNGTLVKDDVYVWQISYTDFEGESYTLRGHVTVLK